MPVLIPQPTVTSSVHASLMRVWKLLVCCLAGLGALVLLVTITPFDQWAARKLAGRWEDPKGDVLIVLGGSMLPDGILGQSSYLRTQYAVLAYRTGGFNTVLFSGGGAGIPAAIAMQRFIEAEGIPPEVIIVEASSRSTRQNALYSKTLLEKLPGRKVLLTSDYHMFRAARVFRNAGVEVEERPIPDVGKRAATWRGRWPAFLDLVTEGIKIVYYYVRGWM
jgi:uncharacterized SAM-binding protein YcdF (DUF218 family)